jgi:hypothetical protein
MMGLGALGISFMLSRYGGPFRIVAVLSFALAGLSWFIPDFRS